MNPKQNLRKDHGDIMKMLRVFQDAIENPSHSESWRSHFEGLLNFVQVYINRCHHAKEENVLFPVLAKLKNTNADGLVDDLCREHRTGSTLSEAIRQQFNALVGQPGPLAAEFVSLSMRYIALYRKHIRVENARLLPIMEEQIGSQEQAHMAQQFERLESENITPEKQETYTALLDYSAARERN